MRRRSARGEGGAAPRLSEAPPADAVEALVTRSRRLRLRGDRRRAIVLLRQACALDEWRARTFTLLGALLLETQQRDDAVRALGHARWLRQRAGETSRAEVTARLIESGVTRTRRERG